MSTEKLSELSNPKAFVVTGGKMYQDRAFTDKSTAERSKADRHDGAVVEPLYSQEYVSALDKVAQFWIGESAGWKKRAEDAEKRIAELEGQLQSGFTPEALAQEERAENAEQRVAELEAKLDTPVRLPNKNDDEFWFDGVFQVAKFDRAVERAISAAGFKFAGDEQ